MIKKHFHYLFLAPSLLIAATSAIAGPPTPDEVRDYQYCELVLNATVSGISSVPVFNTTGYQMSTPNASCADWANLTPQLVIDAYNSDTTYTGGATNAIMNLPRHWVMNHITETTPSSDEILWIAGIEFGFVGNLADTVPAPYVTNTMLRTTVYSYYKGNEVYELIDPLGRVFTMHSFAQFVDPTLTINKLRYIGPKNHLPKGWKYRARKLEADLNIVANGAIAVVNDYFRNTYSINLNAPVEKDKDKD